MRNDYYSYIEKTIKIQEICNKLGIPVNQGSTDMCRCPFHDDHTPSMAIYADNHAYCHACHKRWNNLQFIGEKLNLNFGQQIAWMEENFPQILTKKTVYMGKEEKLASKDGFMLAYQIYADMTEDEKGLLQKYADKRNFNIKFLTGHEVFFSKGRKIQNFYGDKEDTYIEERAKLCESQLLIRQPWGERSITDRYTDYFYQDGIIFTIRDWKQNIVGFAQRVLEERRPKYLFTKNLPKNSILYRMDSVQQIVQSAKEGDVIELFLVEGVFDALRMESIEEHALAVLGSQLTRTQTVELEKFLQMHKLSVQLHIFMDRDQAGQNGNFRTLKNLWNREFFRKSKIDVQVPLKGKDPDQCYQDGNNSNSKRYDPFEYLILYYLLEKGQNQGDVDIRQNFENLTAEDKILCLSRIKHMLPSSYWDEIFDFYQMLEGQGYFFYLIKMYVGEGKNKEAKETSIRTDSYQFLTALQMASTSYEREALPLDELSWERIQTCADTFFTFFTERLCAGEHLRIPLLAMYFPKKIGEERMKALYIHERLILQQYVLNELLGKGENKYEMYIPAVRYRRQDNRIETTVNGAFRETVSFAYEIDMDTLLLEGNTDHGMFRDYYGCWRSYIEYIQEGIEKMCSDHIYRLKLDIRRFYDSIPRYAARKAIYPALLEALRADHNKFSAFGCGEVDDLAEKVTAWILGELYEDAYYDPETGDKRNKPDSLTGIPQGPNLSAYIANIVLFDLDQKIQHKVEQINEGAPAGTILIRYARYVDDMILIACDADDLLRIKDLISSELYELGLFLSPKTDREDGVSKEEAFAWTIDQKGGLGVSAAFDFPDNTLEEVLDEFDGYEVTDRRSALQLLASALFMVDQESFLDSDEQERLLRILFQTQEIRFGDMIRIAELLLVKAARNCEETNQNTIYEEFLKLWADGKQLSPKESLFREDGIEIFAFIEGSNKIFKRKGDSVRAWERFLIWNKTKEMLTLCWNREFIEGISGQFHEKRILKKNRWILKLRMEEICCRMEGDAIQTTDGEFFEKKNVFEWHWYYTFLGNAEKVRFIDPPVFAEEETLEIFHYVAFYLHHVSNYENYKEVQTAIFSGRDRIFAQEESGILGECMSAWFKPEQSLNLKEESIKISLLTLLNLLKDSIKAEIIGKLAHYHRYIFQTEEQGIESCLPVVPGVGFPGLMARMETGKGSIRVQRIDFTDEASVKPQEWLKQKKHMGCSSFFTDLEEGYAPLDTFFDPNQTDDLQIPLILSLYRKLYQEIQNIQSENPYSSVVLSGKNVFVKMGQGLGEVNLVLVFYLLPETNIGSGVLLERGSGRFILKQLHSCGSFFWQAGYLLKNVSRFETWRLRYESGEVTGEKADDVKMLEYTWNRLTGESVNAEHKPKSIHSYKSSVDRAIRRMESFLSIKERRDIFLEDNMAIDSFISQRMRMEYHTYAPAECSYYTAIWSKRYLRNHFVTLIDLSSKYGKNQQWGFWTERRVPRAYLLLSNYIEELIDHETCEKQTMEELQGLQVLACGFRANAVLLQLRMQTLELLESLSTDRRERLKKQKENLPLAVLELEMDQALMVEEGSIESVLDSMLSAKSDKRIGKITHIGWLVLLQWLLDFENINYDEHGQEKQSCRTGEKEYREGTEGSRNFTAEIKKWIHSILDDTEKDEQVFPFEEMSSFFSLWTNGRVKEFFSLSGKIDQAANVEVEKINSKFYCQRMGNRKIQIFLDEQNLEKPNYFLTYSKIGNQWTDIEHNTQEPQRKIFSQSTRNKKTIGISVVEIRLGELLQKAEKFAEQSQEDENIEHEIQEITKTAEDGSHKTQNKILQNEMVKDKRENRIPNDMGKKSYGTEEYLTEIRKKQEESWASRKNNFKNYDRIALFQFETVDSYHHPVIEVCSKLKQNGFTVSCHEYRRRKLLKEVLDICDLMEVQILILPEYSVRPETVGFLYQEMREGRKDGHKYNFSIWAGTFRVPYDYVFDRAPFKELVQGEDIFHAAILPVLMPEGEKPFCHRQKKYPSIPLKEDINPCRVLNEQIVPVVERALEKASLTEYKDARDDVTELICAEVFALSSPGNLISFADAAYQLYQNYGINTNFKDYLEKMMKDILAYGKAISLYREDRQKKRRSIVLVPACTTRAADYYVLGQANYLGSGTNMVFCNGSGKLACGGSCFIGQNSWDDAKGRRKKRIEEEITNIYHGLCPGIYMQTSERPNRGGLGPKEQALLVCDIIPDLDRRKPNPQSMKSALEVVAHIPILEERIYTEECIKNCQNEGVWWKRQQDKMKHSREESRKTIERLNETLNQHRDSGDMRTTASDQNPYLIAESLIDFGEKYKSDWLKARGNRYLEGHKLFPRRQLPETAIDWRYVEIDYQEFMRENGVGCYLEVPATNQLQIEKENGEWEGMHEEEK